MNTEFEMKVDQLKHVYAALACDLDEARSYGQRNPSGFAKRSLFRAAFALIEGISFQFRLVALAGAASAPLVFDAVEMSLLKEERHRLDDKGHLSAERNFQSLLPSILFCMRCYARVHNVKFEPELSAKGYECMKKFIKLRDGITHPKSVACLEHTDQQLGDAVTAMRWWKQQVSTLLKKCNGYDAF